MFLLLSDQRQAYQTRGKSYDGLQPLGPCVHTTTSLLPRQRRRVCLNQSAGSSPLATSLSSGQQSVIEQKQSRVQRHSLLRQSATLTRRTTSVSLTTRYCPNCQVLPGQKVEFQQGSIVIPVPSRRHCSFLIFTTYGFLSCFERFYHVILCIIEVLHTLQLRQ